MLTKNLEALRKTQPKLAQQVEETTVSEKTTLFMGPNGDINIAYEDIALHRMADPMGEALEIFEAEVPESCRDMGSISFIFGLGLGYLLRRVFVNTKGQVIVFEPYMEVLRQTLEAVDLSQEFLSKRVVIITETDKIIPVLGKTYLLGDKFKTMVLPNYREKEIELYLKVLDEIRSSMTMNLVGQNTAIMLSEEFIRSSLENLPHVLRYPEVSMLHDRFKGMPGVVISAGPSLDRPGVMDALRKHRENMVVACVGQATRVLDNAQIKPDFVNILEIKDVSNHIRGTSFQDDLNLILLPQVHKGVFETPTLRKFISHTLRDPLTHWLTKALKKSLYGYNHQGTVSITALLTLMKMGCNPIFLLGQDLAFPEGKMYSNSAIYKDCHIVKDENGKRRVEMANKEDFYGINGFFEDEAGWEKFQAKWVSGMMEVKGWQGETLFTSVQYDTYRNTFTQIQAANKEFNLVNCSEGGVFIEGMEHLPFVEAIEKYAVKTFSPKPVLDKILNEEYYEAQTDDEGYQKVYQQYQQDRQELEALMEMAKEGLIELKKALDELSKKKALTHSLKSRLKKLHYFDSELSALTQNNSLINAYIKHEMFQFSKTYARKLVFEDEESIQEGDIKELLENLNNTRLLYQAVAKGAKGLMKTLDPVIESFPIPEALQAESSTPIGEKKALSSATSS